MRLRDFVNRRPPGRVLWRPEWENVPVGDGQILRPIYYHEALGVAVARYNTLEIYFRTLVGSTIGLKFTAIDVALAHLGPVPLREMLIAASVGLILNDSISEELVFASKLYDANSTNRNFLIHSATEVSLLPGLLPQGMLANKRTTNKRVGLDQYLIPLDVIRRTADEIHDAIDYFAQLIVPCRQHKDGSPLELPNRPSLPNVLASTHPKVNLSELLEKSMQQAK